MYLPVVGRIKIPYPSMNFEKISIEPSNISRSEKVISPMFFFILIGKKVKKNLLKMN
jgi:hypothetical protein